MQGCVVYSGIHTAGRTLLLTCRVLVKLPRAYVPFAEVELCALLELDALVGLQVRNVRMRGEHNSCG